MSLENNDYLDSLALSFKPHATESFEERMVEQIKKATENIRTQVVSCSHNLNFELNKNIKEECQMERLEGSFTINKMDKGYVIEVISEEGFVKQLVSEDYHMYQAVEKIPEALTMIIDDIEEDKRIDEKVRQAKKTLEEYDN